MVLEILESAKKAATKKDELAIAKSVNQVIAEVEIILRQIIPDETKKLQALLDNISNLRSFLRLTTQKVPPNRFDILIKLAREINFDAWRALKLEQR